MRRGRRSGEQRNRAATGYELKKKRRSRMGKGINSPEELDPRRRARKVHWRAGTLLVAGEQGRVLVAGERRLVAGGRRAASGCRGVPARDAARCGRAGMRGRASIAARATGICDFLLGWAVSTKADTPCPPNRYVSAHVSEFRENKKNRILLGYVSDAYRTRIRIRYVSDTRYASSSKYPCNVGSKPC